MEKVKLPVIFRILHWGVATGVLLNAFILENGKSLHRYIGYAVFLIVVLRVLLSKKKNVSHYNSKAKYVYWSIWSCIAGLSITGFLMGLDRYFGNQTLEDAHVVTSNVLLFFVSGHLCGVFLDAFKKKRRTWMVMISGKKE